MRLDKDEREHRKIIQNHLDYTLIMTCYHEAGHVVCAIRNLILPTECQVMTKNKFDAYTALSYFKVPANQKKYRKIITARMVTLSAGVIAEGLFFSKIVGKPLPVNLREGWFKDRKEINVLLKQVEPNAKARMRLRAKIFASARSALLMDWNILVNLAHALYDKKHLSYTEICEVVIKSVPRATHKSMRNFLKTLKQAYDPKTLP